ncbi:MAG: single-stranded-DNA-specific exonuclease RecJ [Candidatus Jacksonbacteria bacterium]|nr:single-stranded-DNA-specific exonuclease RecJ [Candidatus Jacksonbacteria bacterium]MBT6033995.1 single-stranded-DNA-specific exonuclease RecJ [Candidatus Jacksonbacteria bacterium]MBT6301554.1 single-stranded-DNA-specific exonuclease RecJ [Candidatus Jacksonbacteria bacterium]MBT6757485.1 single-stranded-DNA-specific exonuclease RecJ [Candidatus Jacksonbacteria bacterium]MBT6955402.1 single-stranded-DNA-specific exonuclease RecJ [Candidatus Jacksonbacteria bacterium]
MNKRWIIRPEEKPSESNQSFSPLVQKLLAARGITSAEDVEEFSNPTFKESLHDPFLFKDMKKACKHILKAVKKQQSIVIHGDYDADGVCSSVLLYETLEKLGAENVEIYLPHRDKEGYGLNMNTVNKFIEQEKELVITVDCGSTNTEEIAALKEAGIPTIVLDHHHERDDHPPYLAALNPHFKKESYPFKELAGVGVVYKVVHALHILEPEKVDEAFVKWSLDLVAIATVSDCVDLVGENRAIVNFGLRVLQKNRRPGLKAILAAAQVDANEINTYHIGFVIGPRLNAAGRMKHANSAVELLLEKDPVVLQQLAMELNTTNQQRQSVTSDMFAKALEQLPKQDPMPYVLVSHQPFEEEMGSWPVGLVGLVAGKVTQKFFRPTFVIGTSPKGYLGSGRSIPAFNIIEAIEKTSADLFENYGGHAQACGFTFKDKKDIAEFEKRLNTYAKEILKEEDLVPELEIDTELSFDTITYDLINELKILEPHGMANKKPVFCSYNTEIVSLRAIGSDQQHLKLTLKHNNHTHEVIGFRFGDWVDRVKIGTRIDVAYEVDINNWNGNKTIQLRLIDIRETS